MNKVRLNEYLVEITKGTTPTTIGGEFLDEGVNFIKAECLNTGRVIDKESLSYISPEIHKKLNRSILKEGDLLFSIAGHLGKMAIVRKNDLPANTNQAVAILRVDTTKADVEFLYYYLSSKSFSTFINSQCAQSVQPNINLGQVGELPIVEFPSTYQKKISSVLSTLDSKIELNNRINSELEAMAKTLYDYWFVQFDFPDKNGKPYKTSGGKMVWNEELNREIPEGWEVEILNKNVSCILDHRGKTPLKLGGDWVNKGEGVIALSAKHVKDGKLVKLEDANIVGYDMYERWMPEKLKEGDILMTSEAPLGEFYFILNDTNYCMSQRLFAIRADFSKVLSTYLYFELSKGNGFSQIIGKASGSTVFGIRQDELRKVKILKPDLELQILFEEKAKPMLLQIRNNEFQNQKLTQLRDWLLPMLMNGQVKVN